MNSYSEESRQLHLSLLQERNREAAGAAASKSAAAFALYYAQEAAALAAAQADAADRRLAQQTQLRSRVVAGNGSSVAAFDTADELNRSVQQSVVATANAAADVQRAVNAILRVTSGAAGILSLVNAVPDTGIQEQADEVYKLLEEIAQQAELAAQHAMEASIMISEAPASALLDQARSVNNTMTALLQTVSGEWTAALQSVSQANDQRSAAAAAEKRAEANFSHKSHTAEAAINAYSFANSVLNRGLSVTGVSTEKCTVVFDWLNPLFETPAEPLDPVKNYYVLFVKEAKKNIFNSSHAEQMLLNDAQHFLIKPPSRSITTKKGKTTCSQEIFFHGRVDADGDPIAPGIRYVVFVSADYTPEYKRKRNDFDNYLSAPSGVFVITNQLAAVDGKSIQQHNKNPRLLQFEVAENPVFVPEVEYRCVLLPKDGRTDTLPIAEHVKDRDTHSADAPGFMYTLDIALQTPPGHYLIAQPAKAAMKKSRSKGTHPFPVVQWKVTIDADTTDYLGNLLVAGQPYKPVILSVSQAPESLQSCFSSSWSGYQYSNEIIYSAQ